MSATTRCSFDGLSHSFESQTIDESVIARRYTYESFSLHMRGIHRQPDIATRSGGRVPFAATGMLGRIVAATSSDG